jgi:hypothetical protein
MRIFVELEKTASEFRSLLFAARIATPANFHLVVGHGSPSDLLNALRRLNTQGLLTQANFNTVAMHPHYRNLFNIISHLDNAGILTQDNLEMLTSQRNLISLDYALNRLAESGILTVTNFHALMKKENRLLLSMSSINELWEPSYLMMLNQDSFEKLVSTTRQSLAVLELRLRQTGFYTPENLESVLSHFTPGHFVITLSFLRQDNILTQANFDLLMTITDLTVKVDLIQLLNISGILTQENFERVLVHPTPGFDFNEIMRTLKRFDEILNQTNFDALMQDVPDIPLYHRNLSRILSSMRAADVTAENFARLCGIARNPEYYAQFEAIKNNLIGRELFDLFATFSQAIPDSQPKLIALDRVLRDIPNERLTPENFAQLLRAAQHQDFLVEIERVRRQILGHRPVQGLFNAAQSTHTASVHRTVSSSATNLKELYEHDFEVENKIDEIKAYVGRLESTPKVDAAKRCIERITGPSYTFTDGGSGLSIHQLLALAFHAMHDETRRNGSLEDALSLFIDGLYEIQRGGNINETGQDDFRGFDSPICSGGSFNKIMEKLIGIHSAVEVYYITVEGASLKFTQLSQSHALRYLEARLQEAPEDASALIEAIQADTSLAPIWDRIREVVVNDLWEEFQSAFGDNREEPRFVAILANAEYIPSPDLSALTPSVPILR